MIIWINLSKNPGQKDQVFQDEINCEKVKCQYFTIVIYTYAFGLLQLLPNRLFHTSDGRKIFMKYSESIAGRWRLCADKALSKREQS